MKIYKVWHLQSTSNKHVKTAEPTGLKFFVGPHMKVYEKLKKFSPEKVFILKSHPTTLLIHAKYISVVLPSSLIKFWDRSIGDPSKQTDKQKLYFLFA